MKTIKFLIVVLFCSLASFAQTEPKVIAVVSKANWCPACIKNEARVGTEVMSKVDMSKIAILINDLSDKKTKNISAKTMKSNGLEKVNLKTTGVITFIDAKTKKIISNISISKSSEEILEAFKKVTTS